MGIAKMVKWLVGPFVALAMTMLTLPVAAQGIFDSETYDSGLIRAARAGDDTALEIAIISGDSVNDRSGAYSPAILVAAENRHLGSVRILAEAGARVDNRNRRDDRTALTVAADLGAAAIVRVLLEFGADPEYTGSGRETALLKAARNGHGDVIELLIEAGADIDTTDLTGMTALEIAEQNRHRQAAEILRDAGAY